MVVSSKHSHIVHNHPTSLGKRERQGDYLPPGQGPPCTPAGEVPCYLSPRQGSPFSSHLRSFCTSGLLHDEAWQSKFCHASLNTIVLIGVLQLNYDILRFT